MVSYLWYNRYQLRYLWLSTNYSRRLYTINIMIPLVSVSIDDDIQKAVTRVLQSGQLAEGPVVKEFEDLFSKFIGTQPRLWTSFCRFLHSQLTVWYALARSLYITLMDGWKDAAKAVLARKCLCPVPVPDRDSAHHRHHQHRAAVDLPGLLAHDLNAHCRL